MLGDVSALAMIVGGIALGGIALGVVSRVVLRRIVARIHRGPEK